jgi:hypothetical protein
MDEQVFTPAVGLMLLDMLLGPPQFSHYTDTQPGILQSVGSSLNTIMGRFKKR